MAEQEKKQIEVPVAFLKDGTILEGIVYDADGNFIYPDNKPWKQLVIDKLKRRGIKYVYYTPITPNTLVTLKHEAKYILENIIESFNLNEEQDLSDIKSTVENLTIMLMTMI